MTEWRDIPDYEGYYQVSDDGQIKSLARDVIRGRGGVHHLPDRLLKLKLEESGYERVTLSRDGRARIFGVHALVLEAFVGPRPDGYQACHNDGSKANNRVGNLRWDTAKANQADRYKHGTQTNAQKTHCKYGHEFNVENTYHPPAGATTYKRYCRACGRASRERLRAARTKVASNVSA